MGRKAREEKRKDGLENGSALDDEAGKGRREGGKEGRRSVYQTKWEKAGSVEFVPVLGFLTNWLTLLGLGRVTTDK